MWYVLRTILVVYVQITNLKANGYFALRIFGNLSFSDNWWNTPKCFDPEHNSSEAYIKYHREHNDTKTAVEEYWE